MAGARPYAMFFVAQHDDRNALKVRLQTLDTGSGCDKAVWRASARRLASRWPQLGKFRVARASPPIHSRGSPITLLLQCNDR